MTANSSLEGIRVTAATVDKMRLASKATEMTIKEYIDRDMSLSEWLSREDVPPGVRAPVACFALPEHLAKIFVCGRVQQVLTANVDKPPHPAVLALIDFVAKAGYPQPFVVTWFGEYPEDGFDDPQFTVAVWLKFVMDSQYRPNRVALDLLDRICRVPEDWASAVFMLRELIGQAVRVSEDNE